MHLWNFNRRFPYGYKKYNMWVDTDEDEMRRGCESKQVEHKV